MVAFLLRGKGRLLLDSVVGRHIIVCGINISTSRIAVKASWAGRHSLSTSSSPPESKSSSDGNLNKDLSIDPAEPVFIKTSAAAGTTTVPTAASTPKSFPTTNTNENNNELSVAQVEQWISHLSGANEIRILKKEVQEASLKFDQATQTLVEARKLVDTSLQEWQTVSGKHLTLLQRKESWTPADAQEFTTLIQKEVESKRVLEQAKVALNQAENVATQSQMAYMNKLRQRYQEEQSYQDYWRVVGTYGTWSLIGLNSVIFLASQYVHRRREKERMNQIESIIMSMGNNNDKIENNDDGIAKNTNIVPIAMRKEGYSTTTESHDRSLSSNKEEEGQSTPLANDVKIKTTETTEAAAGNVPLKEEEEASSSMKAIIPETDDADVPTATNETEGKLPVFTRFWRKIGLSSSTDHDGKKESKNEDQTITEESLSVSTSTNEGDDYKGAMIDNAQRIRQQLGMKTKHYWSKTVSISKQAFNDFKETNLSKKTQQCWSKTVSISKQAFDNVKESAAEIHVPSAVFGASVMYGVVIAVSIFMPSSSSSSSNQR